MPSRPTDRTDRLALNLTAWEFSDPVNVPASIAAELTSTGLVECVASGPDRFRLRAGSRVGVAVGDRWELRVVPRIAIRQLMQLLSHARTDGWGHHTADFGADDLFAAVANGFSRIALRAVSPVPISGYAHVEESSMVLRGRLRVSAQVAARGALPLPLEVAYDELTTDVPENRLMLGATDLLLRWPRVSFAARQRLIRIRAALDGVHPQPPMSRVPLPAASRRNERYRSALRLAQLILEGHGPSARGSRASARSSTFSFDLNKVFEWFVGDLIADAAAKMGLALREQDPSRTLDEGGAITLQPDFVLYRHRDPVAVLDAKFKRLESPSLPNADAYQLLAYCSGYRIPSATLIYAQDDAGEPRRRHVISGGPVLCVEALDLRASPDAIAAQVERIVRVAATPPTSSQRFAASAHAPYIAPAQ